jgi:hypothetical protein
MDSGHQSAFDKIFKMAATPGGKAQKCLSPRLLVFFGKFSGVFTLKACKEAKNVIVVGYSVSQHTITH